MNSFHMNLHSENFDLCRLCLFEPESNRQITFKHIFSPDDEIEINKLIWELLAIKVDNNGILPKIICENCYNALWTWNKMKEKAAESQIVINYIEKSRYKLSGSLEMSSNEIKPSTSGNHNLAIMSSSCASPNNSDDDASCEEVIIPKEVICISDSEESIDNSSEVNNDMEQDQFGVNEDTLYSSDTNISEEIIKHKRINGKNKQSSSISPFTHCYNHALFTCLEPSCNFVFPKFFTFKQHYREHSGVGNDLMCWQCCKSFIDGIGLRKHQTKGECRTPGMFKCYTCPEKFDDLQTLSVHKYTMHESILICKKKTNITCNFCKTVTSIDNFKNHLIKCQTAPNSMIKKTNGKFKCTICNKTCLTKGGLGSHKKTHKTLSSKQRNINTYMEMKNYSLASTSDNVIMFNPVTKKRSCAFKCAMCEKICLSKGALGKHKKIHL